MNPLSTPYMFIGEKVFSYSIGNSFLACLGIVAVECTDPRPVWRRSYPFLPLGHATAKVTSVSVTNKLNMSEYYCYTYRSAITYHSSLVLQLNIGLLFPISGVCLQPAQSTRGMDRMFQHHDTNCKLQLLASASGHRKIVRPQTAAHATLFPFLLFSVVKAFCQPLHKLQPDSCG